MVRGTEAGSGWSPISAKASATCKTHRPVVQPTPVQVPGISRIVAVDGGDNFSVALDADSRTGHVA